MVSGQRRAAKTAANAIPVDHTPWLMLAALAAFGGSLFSGFHFDDYGMLQDPAVTSPGGWLRCWSLWQTRPLTWFTFWLNYQLSGRDPMLWHAVNLALHAGCAAILYRWLRGVMPDVAWLGALLFALHPLQAEAVDYVYARAIVLCVLFSLLAARDWWRDRDWTAVAWFTLAVLSKEECVTVPLVLALYALWRGQLRRRMLPLAAMLGIAALAGLRVMAAIQATGMRNIGMHAGISPWGYLSEQGIAIARYFGLLVVPWGFTVDAQLPSAWGWRGVAWLALGSLMAAAAWRFRAVRAARWMVAGFVLLIPSSSVFPAADLAADRRMYLPLLALAPAVALLLPRRGSRWLVAVPCALALLSMERTWVWGSDERLWREAASLAPGKVRPRLQLARAVAPGQAVAILREAERLDPGDPAVPANWRG